MQFAIDIALSLIYFSLFLLFCAWSWRFWKLYVNQKYLNKIDWVMLEIKLPREIMKSPLAAETALSALLQGGGIATRFNRDFQGKLPVFSSVEVASIEGILHFYVRIERRFQPIVEANFYAQYPGIEIVEADDYTKRIRYHHLSKDVSMYGTRYKLTKTWKPWNFETGKAYDDNGKEYEMPADFRPLKTYVDYGLDKNPDEEVKIDPITPMLEFMGAIGKGEHFWFQIIVSPESVFDNKKMPALFVNKFTHEHVALKKMADMFKKEFRIRGFALKGAKLEDEKTGAPQQRIVRDAEGNTTMVDLVYEKTMPDYKKEVELTGEDKDTLEAINRKMSKPLAASVIRLLYIVETEKGKYDYRNIFNMLSWPKPYNGDNSFGPSTTDPYEFPWQNFRGRRVPWRAEEMFEAYVEREGLFPHIKGRDWLDKWEDSVFWSSSMKTRKLFRMIYEGFFHPFEHPQPEDVSVLNLEEIATMWHLPGAVATTPTLPRIDSAKSVAPVNLPQ